MYKTDEKLVRNGPRVYGRILFYSDGHTRFVTERDREGYVFKYSGYGISEDVVHFLISEGIDEIVLRFLWDDDRTSVYKISPRSWRIFGTTDSLGGFEPQVFVSEDVLVSVGSLFGPRVTPILNKWHNPYYDTELSQSSVDNFTGDFNDF